MMQLMMVLCEAAAGCKTDALTPGPPPPPCLESNTWSKPNISDPPTTHPPTPPWPRPPTCIVIAGGFHHDRADQQGPPLLVGHLSCLAQDTDGDHEGVDHLVLLEEPAADVGEHVETDVVDEDAQLLRDLVVLLGPLEPLREQILVELEAEVGCTGEGGRKGRRSVQRDRGGEGGGEGGGVGFRAPRTRNGCLFVRLFVCSWAARA